MTNASNTNASFASTSNTTFSNTHKHVALRTPSLATLGRATMVCVAALGLALVSSAASAQGDGYDSGYDNNYDNGYDAGYDNAPGAYDNGYANDGTTQNVTYSADGTEQVEVTAPPYHHASRSAIGAPIRDVSLSQAVRFDDLDLRSARGARELRHRVRYTARKLCNKLDMRYPISTSDSPPCYRTALRNAMYQANAVISDARYNDAY